MKHLLSISVVSHDHDDHIKNLLLDLAKLQRKDFRVILTLNIPEKLSINISQLPYEVVILNNETPKGFGANHNAAFKICHSKYFVILNPDVRFLNDPFEVMVDYLSSAPNAICAPVVVNTAGVLENNARFFPSPLFLIKKLIYKMININLQADLIPENTHVYFPDWVAGMFIVVASDTFRTIGGFDESYHMYYEDVDFCMRAKLIGYETVMLKDATVIHQAQRDSHRKLKYFIWHLQSILKFFMSKSYLQLKLSRFRGYMNKN